MFYLPLWKNEEYNPEVYQRIKLFWDWKSIGNKEIKKNNKCSWVYGLQNDQIKNMIKSLERKDQRIAKHLDTWLIFNDTQKKLTVKHEYRDDAAKEFSRHH